MRHHQRRTELRGVPEVQPDPRYLCIFVARSLLRDTGLHQWVFCLRLPILFPWTFMLAAQSLLWATRRPPWNVRNFGLLRPLCPVSAAVPNASPIMLRPSRQGLAALGPHRSAFDRPAARSARYGRDPGDMAHKPLGIARSAGQEFANDQGFDKIRRDRRTDRRRNQA